MSAPISKAEKNRRKQQSAKDKRQAGRAGKQPAKPTVRVQRGPKATSIVVGRGKYKGARAPMSRRQYYSDYGSRVGGLVGEGVANFAEAFGLGEYKIKSNSLMSSLNCTTDPPTIMNSWKGEATTIRHREYLGDLRSGAGTPSAFTLQSYAINPGNGSLCPWLSPIAVQYQHWEPRGIIVELKTLSSNYAAGLSLGAMIMAVQYDSLTPAPTSKLEMENMEYAISSKPSFSCFMPIECARGNDVMTHLYVADNGDYLGGDRRFFDLGNLYIATAGLPVADSPIAEIWITYVFDFYKPILGSLPSGFLQFGSSWTTSSNVPSSNTNFLPFHIPGLAYSYYPGSTTQVSIVSETSTKLRINLPARICSWFISLNLRINLTGLAANYSISTTTFTSAGLNALNLFVAGDGSISNFGVVCSTLVPTSGEVRYNLVFAYTNPTAVARFATVELTNPGNLTSSWDCKGCINVITVSPDIVAQAFNPVPVPEPGLAALVKLLESKGVLTSTETVQPFGSSYKLHLRPDMDMCECGEPLKQGVQYCWECLKTQPESCVPGLCKTHQERIVVRNCAADPCTGCEDKWCGTCHSPFENDVPKDSKLRASEDVHLKSDRCHDLSGPVKGMKSDNVLQHLRPDDTPKQKAKKLVDRLEVLADASDAFSQNPSGTSKSTIRDIVRDLLDADLLKTSSSASDFDAV